MRRAILRALPVAALLALAPATTAGAATFTPVDGDALQAALTTAASNGQADTIVLDAATTYTRSGGFSYSAPSGATLTLTGNGATVTATGSGYAVIVFDGGTVDVSALKVTATPGFDEGFVTRYSGTTAVLDDIAVSGATTGSGASDAISLGGTTVTATNLSATALASQGVQANATSATLTGVTVTGATGRQLQVDGGTAEIADVDLRDPATPSAAGIDVSAPTTVATVRRARVAGSNGAVAVYFSGKLTLTDSLLLIPPGGTRAMTAGDSNNPAVNTSDIDAERVTIVGTGASNQRAAAAGDGGSPEADQHTVTLSDSIVFAIPNPLACSAPAGAATNLITVTSTALPAGGTNPNTCTDNGPGITLGAGVTNLLPAFADAAGGDYRPLHTSPLLDLGPTIDPLVGADLGGGLRFVGGAVDLGAYEYQRSAPEVTVGATPASPVGGRPVALSATATDADPGETALLTYAWTFSDGGSASGASPLHVFPVIGPASATVTVTDPTGQATTKVVALNVVAPPAGSLDPPAAPGAPAAATDRTAPALTALRVAKTIRRGARLPAAVGRGGQVRFRLSEAATVVARFERINGKRAVRVPGSVTLKLAAGERAVRFTGRLSKTRALKPGVYRIVLTPTDAARNTGRAVRATFTLR